MDVYRCANEAKRIAAEADRLSREICPVLVRWAAEGGGECLENRALCVEREREGTSDTT